MYNINIPSVNNERKLFFSIVNQIECRNFMEQRDLTKQFIDEISVKLLDVFNHEVLILQKYRCPRGLIDKQIIEHESFVESVAEFQAANFISSVAFVDILKSFIINHIIGTDLETKVHLDDSYIHRFLGFEDKETLLGEMIDRAVLIKWTEYFETGIQEIDKQHRVFVTALNDLVLNYDIYSHETILNILDELMEYAHIHFATEESYMNEVKDDYSYMNTHIEDHKHFIEYLKDKIKHFDELKKRNDIKKIEELLQQLIEWFIKHILGADKEFGEIYKTKHI